MKRDFALIGHTHTLAALGVTEELQDLVGAFLVDSTSIDFTYNDVGNSLSAAVITANPTGTIGLTAVNGTAATPMRSDAAPALSQAIAPTWSALHTFSLVPVVPNDSWTYAKIQNVASNNRVLGRISGAAGDIEELTGANLATIIGTSLGANPSVSIGLTAVNGSAVTYMLSDAAPALSQSISPTWTGDHIFTEGFALSSVQPEAYWIETDQAADSGVWGVLAAGGVFRISAFSDNLGTESPAISITRTTSAINTMTFGAASSALAVSVLTDNTTPFTINGTFNGTYTFLVDNDSNGTSNAARIAFNSGDAQLAFFCAGSGRTSTILTGGPTGAQGVVRTLGAYPLILGANNTAYCQIPADGGFALVDGITAPATLTGWAKIYVDTADGDLKIKFGDGTVKTIVTD